MAHEGFRLGKGVSAVAPLPVSSPIILKEKQPESEKDQLVDLEIGWAPYSHKMFVEENLIYLNSLEIIGQGSMLLYLRSGHFWPQQPVGLVQSFEYYKTTLVSFSFLLCIFNVATRCTNSCLSSQGIVFPCSVKQCEINDKLLYNFFSMNIVQQQVGRYIIKRLIALKFHPLQNLT